MAWLGISTAGAAACGCEAGGKEAVSHEGGNRTKGSEDRMVHIGSYNPGYSNGRCGRGRPVGGLDVPGVPTLPYPGTTISISCDDYRPRQDLSRCLLLFGSVIDWEHGQLCLSRLEQGGTTLANCFVKYTKHLISPSSAAELTDMVIPTSNFPLLLAYFLRCRYFSGIVCAEPNASWPECHNASLRPYAALVARLTLQDQIVRFGAHTQLYR